MGPNSFAYVIYGELQSALLTLLQAVTLSEGLRPDQKVEVIADIKTVQAQILKSEPDRTVLERVKDRLSTLANVAGIANFVVNALRYWPF